MFELLSIKDISQRLGIPQSTLRYYRDIFMEYLPSCGEGKKKRFFKEAVDVFAAIAKGMQQNKPAEEISAELNIKFARFIEAKESGRINETNGVNEMNKEEEIKINDKINEATLRQNSSDKDSLYGSDKPQYSSATNSQSAQNGQLQVLNANLETQTIVSSEAQAIMTVIKNQNQTMKEIAATLNIVAEHQEEIITLKKEVSKLEEQVENQLTKHFQIIDAKLEQAAEKNKPKPLWKRLFG